MRLLFLTTTNLVTNPRILKEIKIASNQKFKVTVVLFRFRHWSIPIEEELRAKFTDVTFIYIDFTRDNLVHWMKSTILNLFCISFYQLCKNNVTCSAYASDKRSFLLDRKLNRLKGEFDLIISHNLGALFPAYAFAKKHQIPFLFDVEDYHPGEVIRTDAVNEKKRREYLMLKLLPHALFVSAASRLIAEEVEKLCKVPVETINNSFYSSEFILPEVENSEDEKVSFVWFSQNINYGRGLELLLPSLDIFKDNVSLTLIGNLNQNFGDNWLKGREYVDVVAPLSQSKLHSTLSKYDIGLALEISSVDLNKDIALSNKIFAYKQAGLFILATDTTAQKEFMHQFENEGYVCEQTIDSFKKCIGFIINNILTIRADKRRRFGASKKIAFETESEKLVALWQKAALK